MKNISNEFYDFKKPDFLIVGAAKTGTTALYYYLRENKEIFFPNEKEPNFFSLRFAKKEWQDENFNILTLEKYSQLFPRKDSKLVVGEASTSYLRFPEWTIRSIEELYDNPKELKIIIVLRDPVKRAFSHYAMKVRDGLESKSFLDALDSTVISKRCEIDYTYDYVGFSMYFQQVKAYLNYFDNVKIILHDDFLANPTEVTNEVCDFLNVSQYELEKAGEKFNAGGVPKEGFAWLHELIFHPSFIKTALRKVMPSSVRWWLKSKLGNAIHKELKITPHEYEEARKLFISDINSLSQLTKLDLTRWLS